MVCLLLPRVNSPHDLPNRECTNLLLSQGNSEGGGGSSAFALVAVWVRQPKLSVPSARRAWVSDSTSLSLSFLMRKNKGRPGPPRPPLGDPEMLQRPYAIPGMQNCLRFCPVPPACPRQAAAVVRGVYGNLTS